MALWQTKMLLHSNGNNQQNEKATYELGKKYLQVVSHNRVHILNFTTQ
jgi:hypothetical protein